MMWLWIFPCVLLVSLGLFLASYSIRSRVYLTALNRNQSAKGKVALTFDDGVTEQTGRVLDVLKKYGTKAAFFVIGEIAERMPETVSRIASEGHLIGNHSYYHKACFPLKSTAGIIEELERCDEVITRITGQKPLYFRPPFGVTNPMVGKAAKKMGYTTIGWSIRSLDTTRRSREEVLKRVVKRIKDGAVILLHDDRDQSHELTEKLIVAIREKGYEIVGIEELFGIKSE